MHAIVLVGGRGSRLAPWHAPKCLLPINGVTILERLLRHLLRQRSPLTRAVLCTGHRAADIDASLRAHGWLDRVRTLNGGLAAEMGQRLLGARELTDAGRVLICYGDELADVDLAALLEGHASSGAQLTFTACLQKVPGGTVRQGADLRPGGPLIQEDDERLVNIGFAVVEPACWRLLDPTDGLSGWINRVRASGSAVAVHVHRGRRATVNSLADLDHAEAVWR